MRRMKWVAQVRNVTRGTELASAAEVAFGPWKRLRGLIGRRSLARGAGLILHHAPWIHTAGMSFPVDVVFCTRAGYVLRTVEHLAPSRISPFCWRAYATLEVPAGAVRATDTRPG